MPRGFTKCLRTIIVRTFGSSKLATSMVSLVESVQYNRRDIQSIAMPSGERISEKTLIHKSYSSQFHVKHLTFINESFTISAVILNACDFLI